MPPPESRPTKSSILRDVAIRLKGENKLNDCSASCSSITPPSTPGARSVSSLSGSRRAFEDYQNDEIKSACSAERRRFDIMLSHNAGAHRRALSCLRKTLKAMDDKDERLAALEQRKQEADQEHNLKHERVERSVSERKRSIKAAYSTMQEERRSNASAARKESRSRESSLKREESALLDERRKIVSQMQEMEARRARLLQRRREHEILTKRREIAKMRNEFVEQHEAMKTSSEQKLEEKREHEYRERSRKYEDLVARAQQLERLRSLDRELNQQLRAESESRKAVRKHRVEEARKQGKELMQLQYVERNKELAEEEGRLFERISPQHSFEMQQARLEFSGKPSVEPSSKDMHPSPTRGISTDSESKPLSAKKIVLGSPRPSPKPLISLSRQPVAKSAHEVTQRLTSTRARTFKLAEPRQRSSSRELKVSSIKSPISPALARKADKICSPASVPAVMSLASAFEAVTRPDCDVNPSDNTVESKTLVISEVATKPPQMEDHS